eukprot:1152605-Pelagomonas_calceolata.AAC.6
MSGIKSEGRDEGPLQLLKLDVRCYQATCIGYGKGKATSNASISCFIQWSLLTICRIGGCLWAEHGGTYGEPPAFGMPYEMPCGILGVEHVTLTGICAYFWHCRKYDWGLSGVWWGLVLFFLLRAGQSSLRALWLLRSGRVLAVGSDSMKDENGLPSAAPSPEETPKSKGSSNGGPQAAHQEGPQDTEGASYERPHAVHQEGPGDTEGGENRQPQAVHHEEGRSNGDTKGRNNERPMGAAQEGDPKGTQNGSGCPPGAGHEGGESGPRDAARKGGESGPRDAAMKGGLQ